MKEPLGPASTAPPVNTLTSPDQNTPASLPGGAPLSEGEPFLEEAAAADSRCPRPRYVLVEDLDYLMRTGRSRQILAVRWTV